MMIQMLMLNLNWIVTMDYWKIIVYTFLGTLINVLKRKRRMRILKTIQYQQHQHWMTKSTITATIEMRKTLTLLPWPRDDYVYYLIYVVLNWKTFWMCGMELLIWLTGTSPVTSREAWLSLMTCNRTRR